MRKYLSVILILICVTLVFGTAQTIYAEYIPNTFYDIGEGYIGFDTESGYVTSCAGYKEETSLKLPEKIKGVKVVGISEYAFAYHDELVSVEIPGSVTDIAPCAFSNCINLTSVKMHDGVTSIGRFAFSNCESLKEIELPKSLTTIGSSAFNECESLESIRIPEGVSVIEHAVFASCKSLKSVNIPGTVTTISDFAFASCDSLREVSVPQSVAEIGDCAFRGCGALKSINVDRNNRAYASYEGVLFSKDMKELVAYPLGRSGLHYTVPDKTERIKEYAFIGCENLMSISMPDTVTEIGEFALAFCKDLADIKLPDSLEKLGKYAFWETAYCNGEDNWENGVLYVGNYLAISDQNSVLDEVTVKDGTIGIADNVFEYAGNITNVKLPESLRFIGDEAFANCPKFQRIQLPERLKTIGKRAFAGCELIEKINVPDSVLYIGEEAFICGALKEAVIGKGAAVIGDNAFSGKLIAITVSSENTEYKSVDGVLFNKDMTRLIKYPSYSERDAYDVPSSVTEVYQRAFSGCKNLLHVTFGDNLESIGEWAFSSSSVTTLKLPEGLTSIGEYAFWSGKITSIDIPDSVTNIGKGAFYRCTDLKDVKIGNGLTEIGRSVFEDSGLTSVVIPENVTKVGDFAFCGSDLSEITIEGSVESIGDMAFAHTHITNIVIPGSIGSIGEGAFYNCDSMTDIYYRGTAEEWANIENVDWIDPENITIHYMGG